MIRPSRIAAVASLIVAVALAAVVLTPGAKTYRVTAVFDQAYGLVNGGQVWAGGAVVGKVADVQLGSDGLPRVRMDIEDGYRLRRGATADLRVHSNAGELNRVIVLHAGRGAALPDGTVLTRTSTDQPVEIDDVVDTFDPAMRDDLRHVLATLDDSSHGLQRDFRAGLRASAGGLNETASLLGEVGRDGAALRQLVTQGSRVSEAFAAQRQALGSSTAQLSALLTSVARRDDALRRTMRDAPASLGATTRALRQLRSSVPALRGLVSAAAPVARQLAPTDALLLRALPIASPALRDLAATISTAGPGLRASGRLLDATGPASRSLTAMLQRALPDLDLVRSYTPEITGFLTNYAAQGSTYDAAGHGIRIYSGPTSPQNTVVPPDEFRSGWLALPFARTPGSLVNQPWRDFRSSFLAPTPKGSR